MNSTTQEQPQHSARGHHPYSPSTLQSREASPCYKPASGGSNKASERGTAQHEAVESGSVALLNDEEALAVAVAMDCLDAAINALGGDDEVLIEREIYLPIDEETHRVNLNKKVEAHLLGKTIELDDFEVWQGTTGGYPDAAVINLKLAEAHILDWKFGKFAVEPALRNLQGWAYTLGLVKRIRDQHGVNLKKVRVSFVSPHIEDRSDAEFDIEKQGEEMRRRIVATVVRAKLADHVLETEGWDGLEKRGLLTPTTSACIFCDRLPECPAIRRAVAEPSKKYQPLNWPARVDERALNLTDNADAAAVLALTAIAARWAKEVRGRITDYALRNEDFQPDGYKLIVTYPRKVVGGTKNLFDVTAKLLSDAGLIPHGKTAEEVLWAFADLPLTPVEEFISNSAERGQKTAAVEKFSSALEQAGVVEKSTVPTVSLRMKSKK